MTESTITSNGKKVLVTPRSFYTSGRHAYELLCRQGWEIIINKTGKTYAEDELTDLCSSVDGVIVGIDPMTERVLRNAPRLKAISKYGAGLDNIDLKTAKELGISVERATGANALSVAELAVGLMFSLARHIPWTSAVIKNGGWERKRGVEIAGKTLGIIGFGSIGREVGRLAYGLGMRVIAYDPFVNSKDEYLAKYRVELTDMDTVLRQADFISLHTPLVKDTFNLIDREKLGMMKKGAYLINTARAELVDEDALYDALVNERIAGAAQDAFSQEPPSRCRLFELDNFIPTAHIGAFTEEGTARMAIESARNLIRMLSDE